MIEHEQHIKLVFERVCKVLKVEEIDFRIMQRRSPVNTKRGYTLGYIDLKKKIICVDIYTARKRSPKKVSSILNVIAHEIAHIQKLPFRQIFRGKWIIRQHYPEFYKQCGRNLEIIKNDFILRKYFE